MKKILTAFLVTTTFAFAGSIPPVVRKTIPSTRIDAVKKIGKHLYEVKTGNNIVYVTEDGYLILGVVYKNGKNITEQELNQLVRDQIQKLDLAKAIHLKHGNLRVVAFLDPECPYSREVWKQYIEPNLSKLDLYVFLYPLPFHKKAKGKSCFVLDSKDKEKALKEVMEGKSVNLKECDVKPLLDEAKKVNLTGVPLLFVYGKSGIERIEGLNRNKLSSYFPRKISFKDFNLEYAVQVGSGKGKKIVVITDPLCPFCRKACSELRKYAMSGKATFYVYFVPTHGRKSEEAIVYILSQPKIQQARALAEIFGGKKDYTVKTLSDKQKKNIVENVKEALNSGITATPTFIFENGKVIKGAKIKEIEKEIER
ncbi:thioredoxin fold domain-containing protein [Desulfurobacterium sp. TC5-1]|uniref:thioredoxin fold domain-containing protein n=1 Tax=Desulfurobacterium sp. TC5-1 TaxID=1158318 RepID=UPI0003B6BAB8|nr:thioredoxin fold domain-containing protein [Desulfurobacterium sp. TC5-1]